MKKDILKFLTKEKPPKEECLLDEKCVILCINKQLLRQVEVVKLHLVQLNFFDKIYNEDYD